jgi:site-specific DNA recombinase
MDVCGVYCRVSTEGQKDNYSINDQRDDGITFAKSKHIQFKLYEDVMSGTDITRHGWNSLISDIKNETINMVWVGAIDRFSRDVRSGLDAVELMREKHIKLFVAGVEYDLNDDTIELLISVQFQFAKFEWRKIKSRMESGRRRSFNEGHRRFSGNMYGYERYYSEDGTPLYRVVDSEAEVIRRVYKLYLSGEVSVNRIAVLLNEDGVPTKREGQLHKGKVVSGSQWQNTHINGMLTRPMYAGLVYNYDKTQLIESTEYEAIIDRDEWYAVQEKHKKKMRVVHRTDDVKSFMSGVLQCGYCLNRYHYVKQKSGGKEYEYYRHEDGKCSDKQTVHHVPVEEMNALGTILYRMQFENEDHITEMIERETHNIEKKVEDSAVIRQRLETQKAELGAERKRLIGMVQKGLLDVDDLSDEFDEIKKKEAEIDDKLSSLMVDVERVKAEIDDAIHKFSIEKLDEWENASITKKRQMFRDVLKHWFVLGKEHNIRWITGKETEFIFDKKYLKVDMSDANAVNKMFAGGRELGRLRGITRLLMMYYAMYKRGDYEVEYIKKMREFNKAVDNNFGIE